MLLHEGVGFVCQALADLAQFHDAWLQRCEVDEVRLKGGGFFEKMPMEEDLQGTF